MGSSTLGLNLYNSYELPSLGDYPYFTLLVYQGKTIKEILCSCAKLNFFLLSCILLGTGYI